MKSRIFFAIGLALFVLCYSCLPSHAEESPEARRARHRQMIKEGTPSGAEIGPDWKMAKLDDPTRYDFVSWIYKGKKAYTVEIKCSDSTELPSLKAIEKSYADLFEKRKQESSDPKILKMMDPNFTIYPDIGDQCYSIWTESRRYYLLRGPFRLTMLAQHGELPLELLRAYDKAMQRFLKDQESISAVDEQRSTRGQL